MARSCTAGNPARAALLGALLLLGACGGQRVDDAPAEAELVEPGDDETAVESAATPVDCVPPERVFDDDPMLERTQKTVYQVVYHSSRWFDGLFGSSDVQCAGSVSRGYVGPGFRWDERNGYRGRLRFRADIALPAISDRANLVIGRFDTDDFVDGTGDDNINTLPSNFNDFNEQDLVLGVGFANVGGLRKGWDLGVGVKVRAPPEPYVKLSYHWNPLVSDQWLWRVTPMVFAQSNRGKGVSLTSVVDYAPSERWLFRTWAIGTLEDEVEGTAWTGKLSMFQSLPGERAISYSVYANGETEAEVPLLDYGFEIRYRQRFLRPWFFVEVSSSLSWPREFLLEERKENIGFGLEFYLFFGEDYHQR
jgi:hypothetical protein